MDSSTADLFTLQNEITSRIAIALHFELLGAEAARSIEHPDAVDYTLQAHATWLKPRSRDMYARAVSLFERVDVGSRFYRGAELAGDGAPSRVLDGLTDTPAADIARAEVLAAQAVTASSRNQHALFAKARCFERSAARKRPFPNTRW